MGRSAFDCKHVKSVRAWALFHPDASQDPNARDAAARYAGKVVADYSDNPAGSVVTCTVVVWHGPLARMREAYEEKRGGGCRVVENPMTGRAGGGGYCKFSAAFHGAVRMVDPSAKDLSGRGEPVCRAYLESHGYTVVEVV